MTLANVAATLISIYSFLIWLRILFTWIRIPGQPGFENGFTRFLSSIIDPYLAWFSGIKMLKRERFDLTPLVALAVLSVFESILRLFGTYGTLTPGMVGGTIIQTFWSYIISPAFWFLFIILVIRLVFCHKKGPNTMYYIRLLDSMDENMLSFVQKLFFGNKAVNDRTIVWASVIFYLVCYVGARWLCSWLVSLMVSL